jgi:hypothetical protein
VGKGKICETARKRASVAAKKNRRKTQVRLVFFTNHFESFPELHDPCSPVFGHGIREAVVWKAGNNNLREVRIEEPNAKAIQP